MGAAHCHRHHFTLELCFIRVFVGSTLNLQATVYKTIVYNFCFGALLFYFIFVWCSVCFPDHASVLSAFFNYWITHILPENHTD